MHLQNFSGRAERVTPKTPLNPLSLKKKNSKKPHASAARKPVVTCVSAAQACSIIMSLEMTVFFRIKRKAGTKTPKTPIKLDSLL